MNRMVGRVSRVAFAVTALLALACSGGDGGASDLAVGDDMGWPLDFHESDPSGDLGSDAPIGDVVTAAQSCIGPALTCAGMVSDKYVCEGQPVGGVTQMFDSDQVFVGRADGSIAVFPSLCSGEACFSFARVPGTGLTLTLPGGTVVPGIQVVDIVNAVVPCPGGSPQIVQDFAGYVPDGGQTYCAAVDVPVACPAAPAACPAPSECVQVSALTGQAGVCVLKDKACDPCSLFNECELGKESCWRVPGDAAYGRCVLSTRETREPRK